MVPATRKFADRSPFFQLREHFQQGSVVGFLEMEAATDILGGGWICPNLQKTKYVIGAQVRRARHRLGPASGNSGRGGFYSFFFGERETFFGGMGLHTQANTRPAARPPSGQSDIPRKGNLGGGTTWPASPIFFQTLIPNCQSIPITAIKTLAVTRTHLLRLVQPIYSCRCEPLNAMQEE